MPKDSESKDFQSQLPLVFHHFQQFICTLCDLRNLIFWTQILRFTVQVLKALLCNLPQTFFGGKVSEGSVRLVICLSLRRLLKESALAEKVAAYGRDF